MTPVLSKMSMFDTVRSSHPELPGLFQTKDLDSCMFDFYLDRVGVLWRIDYTGTFSIDFTVGAKLRSIPNGNRGRVYPTYITKDIRVVRDRCSPDGLSELYTYQLHFVEGVLQSHSVK